MHLDPRTALIVVDVQNDFADPAGSLSVEGATRVIPIVNAAIAEIRDAHGLVVYTQDWHPETTPHFEKDGGIWPVHCVADTWGAELHPDLEPPEPDTEECVIRKGTNGEDG
jgi:nicotinamidase/pyrazinamidase